MGSPNLAGKPGRQVDRWCVGGGCIREHLQYALGPVHVPSLRNIRGVAIEIRAGLGALADWPSRVRWTADLFLHRAPPFLQGPRRSALRTIRLREGVRLRYRLNRGDLQSFREVWLSQTYRFPADLGRVETIVDLGANIGLTSVYLARRYQVRRLVSVEPVPSNADLARQNLALNGIEGDVIEAAVGSGDGVAYFQDFADSNVGRLADRGRKVPTLSMQTILARVGADEIDILKVDIEGAEAELFFRNRSWLRQVRSLIVEFHPCYVDPTRLITLLENEGFRHIPAGSVHDHSATAFLRESKRVAS